MLTIFNNENPGLRKHLSRQECSSSMHRTLGLILSTASARHGGGDQKFKVVVLHCELEASLGYVILCLKTNKNHKVKQTK